MKNPYKKHLQIFAKNTRQPILIERHNGIYYIADGFTMLKIPAGHYELFAVPVNPLYIILQDEQAATRRRGEKLPELKPGNDRTLFNIWEKTQARIPAKITRLLTENSQNTAMLRYIQIGENIHLYNENYISAMREYCGENVYGTRERFPVLLWEDPTTGTGCMILPVNNPAARDTVVKIAEVIKK